MTEHACPTCGHVSRVYRRALTSVAARALVGLYADHGTAPAHMPSVVRKHLPDAGGQGGYVLMGKHWGLLVEDRAQRPDGGRAGWWRVTLRGELFVLGRTSVPVRADPGRPVPGRRGQAGDGVRRAR
jgi:hypothetical protein